MNREIMSFIGLMNRAGILITGTDMVINGVRSGKVGFVLVDSKVSDNTLKKITDKCKFYNVSYIVMPAETDLGSAIGKGSRKIIGITDQNFIKALKEKLEKQ